MVNDDGPCHPGERLVGRVLPRNTQRTLTEEPVYGALRRRLLDVLAPGRQPSCHAASGVLAIARPANAPILEEEHLGRASSERIGGDDGAGFFDGAATEQSETHVTSLPV